MPEITYREAVRLGLREALDSDPSVFLMGEDVGRYGGAYAVTAGFLERYGPERVRDTPISEATFVGAGIGAAVGGLRPVVELMSISFSLVAFDQIINMAAKLRYMSGGQLKAPLVIRTPTGGGLQLGATHSQSLENWFASTPGLKVVVPFTPYDALGLLRSAIADDNPVVFAEHGLLYSTRGDVPGDYYTIPLGEADVKRVGGDVTLVGFGHGMGAVLEAADRLAERGAAAEVIDLRSLRPLDMDAVVESVRKTNRLLVYDENWRTGGFMAEVAAQAQERATDDLDGPVVRVGGEDVPSPYSRSLERLAVPGASAIVEGLEAAYGL